MGQHGETQASFHLLPSYGNLLQAHPSGTPGYLKAIVFQELLISSLLPGNLLQIGVSMSTHVTAVPRRSGRKQKTDTGAEADACGQNGVDLDLHWVLKPALLQQTNPQQGLKQHGECTRESSQEPILGSTPYPEFTVDR